MGLYDCLNVCVTVCASSHCVLLKGLGFHYTFHTVITKMRPALTGGGLSITSSIICNKRGACDVCVCTRVLWRPIIEAPNGVYITNAQCFRCLAVCPLT